ncbi:MAG: hypothetical protein K8H86_03655 [Ignavibacteriaceae bacterium]|nr:hypothetical protein [Ignavibacteriaceae bacterium]
MSLIEVISACWFSVTRAYDVNTQENFVAYIARSLAAHARRLDTFLTSFEILDDLLLRTVQ